MAKGKRSSLVNALCGWDPTRLRKARGLRQGDVAAELGVDPRTLRRWEAGETTPPPEKVARLVELLEPQPWPQIDRERAKAIDVMIGDLMRHLQDSDKIWENIMELASDSGAVVEIAKEVMKMRSYWPLADLIEIADHLGVKVAEIFAPAPGGIEILAALTKLAHRRGDTALQNALNEYRLVVCDDQG